MRRVRSFMGSLLPPGLFHANELLRVLFLSVVRIQIFDYTASNTVYVRGYVDEPRNISSVVRFYIDSCRKFPDPVE